uniref:t-SNARE coiled-coil homology domain-containing protein n=1 Tax=Haemonchus contortus TaxID=6289 RepID=A0A7I4YCP6_HAECO
MAEEEQNVVGEEVPAEPDNNHVNQQQDQQPQEEEQQHQGPQQQQQGPQQQQQGQDQGQPAFNFEGFRRQIPEEEELSLMRAEIQRILGRTDAISSMKNRIDMIHREVHVVEHSVQSIKDLVEEAMDGLVKVNNLQKQILNRFKRKSMQDKDNTTLMPRPCNRARDGPSQYLSPRGARSATAITTPAIAGASTTFVIDAVVCLSVIVASAY